MNDPESSFGEILRRWRRQRGLTQLSLANQADISARHLCFLETGRAQPSRDMLLRLAEHLQVPLRDRNSLLMAAGFAAVFPERPLADPALAVVRKAIDLILQAHDPYPAFAVDRYWTLVASNNALRPFLGDVDSSLLHPPVNVLRLTLHPQGLAPRLANYHQWRSHVLIKLSGQVLATADSRLSALLQELQDYAMPVGIPRECESSNCEDWHRLVVPFQLATDFGILSFYSTTTIFGTPIDTALSELSLELFYPADKATVDALRRDSDRTRNDAPIAANSSPSSAQ